MGDEGAGEGGAGEGGGAGMAKLARSTRAGRSALVLSAGGANGAYEGGVVRALFEGASPGTGRLPLAPRIFTGTSVGGYNAAVLAQHAAAGAGGGTTPRFRKGHNARRGPGPPPPGPRPPPPAPPRRWPSTASCTSTAAC